MARFNNNWLNLYHEYNQDLTQHEILLIGEIGDRQIKWAYPVPTPVTDENFNSFIKMLNGVLEDVYRLDRASN